MYRCTAAGINIVSETVNPQFFLPYLIFIFESYSLRIESVS